MEKMQVRVARPGRVVRACVPLPPGFSGDFERETAFVLVDPAGVQHPAQASPVAWRAPEVPGHDTERQLAVVEVSAILAHPATGPEVFQLVPLPDAPLPSGEHRPGAWAARVARRLRVAFDDAEMPMSGGATFRNGRVQRTCMFHGRNFNLWLTTFSGLDVVEFDLLVHAGCPGSSALVFGKLALSAPESSIEGVFSWPEPKARISPLTDELVLVDREQNVLHPLPKRGMRHFHGVLYEALSDQRSIAVALAEGGGWGVSLNWKSDWACWQGHALPLPDLEYRRATSEAQQIGAWSAMRDQLESGGPIGLGSNATQGVRIDWLHPWGGRYGGITGGGYRHQWVGVDVASTGRPEGLLELQARLATILARDQVAIVEPASGQPAVLEDYLNVGSWRMSRTNANFDQDTALFVAPDPVLAQPFLSLMDSYEPLDWQHRDRATQPAVALVWLCNSPVAHWYLRMSAELWRWAQHSGRWLDARRDAALASPRNGSDVGRADGHGFTCMAAAYAIAGKPGRRRLGPFLERFAELLMACQASNGTFRSVWGNKQSKTPPFGDGKQSYWTCTKGTEEALLAGALLAARAQLWRNLENHPDKGVSERTLDLWVLGFWSKFWRNGSVQVPHDYVGQRPIDWINGLAKLGPFANDGSEPTLNSDGAEVMAVFGAVALQHLLEGPDPMHEDEHLLDVIAMAAAKDSGGALDPLGWMKKLSLYKLELDDRAPLHAFLERY